MSNSFPRMKNDNPKYIPSRDQVDFLIEYTKKLRLYPQSIPTSIGRKYDYESKIHFVEGSKLGEPLVSKETLYMYLLFLTETVTPETEEQEKDLEYIKEKMKELKVNESPDEEEVTQ